jgi:caffeoyl-CoA O-methyltransferase
VTPKTRTLSPELHAYLLDHSAPLDDVQRDLIAETAELGGAARMQIAPEQGLLLTQLTKLVNARHTVEVGTFTGYSSLAIARGLAPGGQLLCCDISEEWTATARKYWERAGVADRIELRIAPALETLRQLPTEPTLDLSFIDADKESYRSYWDELISRTRPGGLVCVDNVFWGGHVLDSEPDETTAAIQRFNDHARADTRVELVMLPIADGLTLARRI